MMKKLDIISELRHIQEQSRTSANVLTSIIRQLEKGDIQKTQSAKKKSLYGEGDILNSPN